MPPRKKKATGTATAVAAAPVTVTVTVTSAGDDAIDLNSLTVAELKASLKEKGLAVGGGKAALIARLEEDAANGSAGSATVEELPPAKKPTKKKAASKRKTVSDDVGDNEEEEEVVPKAAKKAKLPATTGKVAAKAKATPKAKVDDACPLSGAAVHGDWDATLNQTNIGANNNKYYRIQLLVAAGKYYCWTHWGRVGEPGQNNLEGPTDEKTATKSFEKKFKDKTKNNWADRLQFVPQDGKYTLLEMEYDDTQTKSEAEVNAKLLALQAKRSGAGGAVISDTAAEEDEEKHADSVLAKPVQELLKLIFSPETFNHSMRTMGINVAKMPLGSLKKSQIQKGHGVLEELESAIKTKNKTDINRLSSQFYTLIPHDFGRRIPDLIDNELLLRQKQDMLNVLGDIEVAQELETKNKKKPKVSGDIPEHPLDTQYGTLDCDLEPLDKKSKEYKVIEAYMKNTQGAWRAGSILDVFTVNRRTEAARFAAHHKINNRKLLWHGTNVAVVAAILNSGLRIMPHSGGRVGRGIYFASEQAKSAGYVGTAANGVGIMFLNEVALGNEHSITRDDHTLKVAPKGYDCIIARGQTEPDPKHDTSIKIDGNTIAVPQGKPIPTEHSNSTFSQSEYLVYQESQARIRYLLKIQF